MKTAILFLILFSTAVVFGQESERIRKIDSALSSFHQQGRLNGNVLIAEKGRIIYQKSFGLANEDTKEELNENSVFELASVSKQFTAMAIAILKEKGKLSYDDPLARYIPELGFYKGISVRNLLTHTGGLPDYMQLFDSVWDKSRIAANSDIIQLFARHKPEILFEAGSKFQYSNTGYALLASIVEKASGQSFADFLRDNIFRPLGMNRSFVHTRRYKPKKIDNYAFGYVPSDSLRRHVLPDSLAEYSRVFWLDGIVGDGAVNSTTGDLLRWDRALYSDKLVSKKNLNEIFTNAVLPDGEKTGYGFGWFIEDSSEYGKTASHSGGWPGYTTYIDRQIDNDKTVIVLQNRSRVAIPSKTIRLALYNKALPVPVVRKEVVIADSILERYVGEYEFAPDVINTITRHGSQLKTQLTGQNSLDIFPESENRFFLKVVDAQIEFVSDQNGKVIKSIIYQGGRKTEAKKVK